MQRRFHISYHSDFESAVAAKKEISKQQPNNFFQIRKRKNNFDLVGRIQTTEKFEESESRRRKRRAWKKSDNAPPFNYKYNNEKARENGTGKWTERMNSYKADYTN